MLGIGGRHTKGLSNRGAQAVVPHQLGDSVFTARESIGNERFVHARTSVGIMLWQGVNPFHLGDELRVLLDRRRRLALQPMVIACARDLQDTALNTDRPDITMLVNEGAPQRLSFAKKAVAFLKYRARS